ncbi:G-type lectin S-receptor-like serine/threonine-protein kinase At2g19130 [Linum perenne]
MGTRILRPRLSLSCLILLCFSLDVRCSRGSVTILPGQSLSGNQTLTSPEGNFALGFFQPGRSSGRHYIGIWYNKLPNQTVVWVANRDLPVSDPSRSELKLYENGNLAVRNESGNVVWSTNSTSRVSNSSVARLLDNGNFVISDVGNLSVTFWQSFDHPTDHWLPGSKIGYSKVSSARQILASWRSPINPAPSEFTLEPNQNGSGHVLLWNGSKMYWTSGVWNGRIFSLVPEIQLNYYVTNMSRITNDNEDYFTYDSAVPSAFTRFVVESSGQLKQYVWGRNFTSWTLFWTRPTQQCQVYAFCGASSICNLQDEPLCICIEGFEPKTQREWDLGDHSGGCVRKAPLSCTNGGIDKFLTLSNMQFPSDPESFPAANIQECESLCLRNCSCDAFAYDNNGCLIWKGSLFNLQQLLEAERVGKDIHVRVSSTLNTAELPTLETKHSKKRTTVIVVAATVAGALTLCIFVLLLVLWTRRNPPVAKYEARDDTFSFFSYKELKTATKNFSEKIGEGGFGSVFKGTLPNSTLIAVKQLKSGLQQSEKQFMAEVKTIGTIQHINLVRLRGFSVESSKRFLVYEYMPNGSLETLLFQQTTAATTLSWKSRYQIALGTARGLSYLHEGCRDCIIHCDIKPDNILLDSEYTPKVADLGLAKIFGHEVSRVLTTMRGTRGYLAPEWISGEPITSKADVFSYGMLLLEIISGSRNRDYSEVHNYFPLQLASTVSRQGEVLPLLDKRLEGNADLEELTRACKVACWCIQDNEKDRPTMKQVVQILDGVSDVSTPPIPRFLHGFADIPAGSVDYLGTSSSTE